MKTHNTEVLIIGSGFGGAVPALRFAEAGFKTIIIDKGPAIDPQKDFEETQDPKYLLKYIKTLKGKNIALNYVEGEGGGSGFYECVSLRAPSIVFDQQENGNSLWGNLSRHDLDPYYIIGEKMLNVHQIQEHKVPKSGLVFSYLMKNLGYSVDRARYAVKKCIESGRCVTGCIYGAKQSLHMNYLPRARRAGAIFESGLDALFIKELKHPFENGLYDSNHYRYEVSCKKIATGETITYRTRLLFLGGGTVGTSRLLLQSKPYLARLSDHVGRNIAFNGSVKIAGLLPDWCPDGDLFTGRSHPGMVSYHFVNTRKIMISAAKPLPLQLFGVARITEKNSMTKEDYWGKKHVNLMKKLRRRILFIVAHGMTPPGAEIHLKGNGELKLKLKITRELKAYYDTTKKLLESIITRNGGKLLNVEFLKGDGSGIHHKHFTSSHQVGSCRMADSKMNGVASFNGEVFDYPGLYICDGAAVPTSTIVNVSLTILANSERITELALKKYRDVTEIIQVKR